MLLCSKTNKNYEEITDKCIEIALDTNTGSFNLIKHRKSSFAKSKRNTLSMKEEMKEILNIWFDFLYFDLKEVRLANKE